MTNPCHLIFITCHLIFQTTYICWGHIQYMLHYFQITYTCWSYVYFVFHTKHICVIVVRDMFCSKNQTTCTYFFFVCSTPGPMSSPDTVSNFTVSQRAHRSYIIGYHDHVSTVSSPRDCVSQSTLSHDKLANRCGRRSSSHSSPLSETSDVWGNSLLKNIPS